MKNQSKNTSNFPEIRVLNSETPFEIDKLDHSKTPWDTVGFCKKDLYDVYFIPGYPHTIGGLEGINVSYACPRNKKLTPKTIISFRGHSCCWGFAVKQVNVLHNKWSSLSIERDIHCNLTRNGEVFYEFRVRDLWYAAVKAQQLLVEIEEHAIPFHFQNYAKEIVKRPVYLNNTACTIDSYSGSPDQMIRLKAVDGEKFRQPRYWDNNDSHGTFTLFEEGPESDEYQTDIFDKDIYWFRED